MQAAKERITAYVDDATAYEIKQLSEKSNVSMSKLLTHAIAKMAYLKNMSQNEPIAELVCHIFIAFGFAAELAAKEKIEIAIGGQKTAIDASGSAADIAKRIVQLHKNISAEALKADKQTSAKMLLSLPLIAQEIRIYGATSED